MSSKKSIFRTFWVLCRKNILHFIRDRTLLILSVLTPILLIGALSNISLYSNKNITYTIGICNFDRIDIENPITNLSSRVSIEYIDVLKELKQNIDDNETCLFNVIEYSPEDYQMGLQDCDDGKLTSLLIIPQNFSECVIGSTWWYELIITNNFSNIDELVTQNKIDNTTKNILLNYINGTNFPLDTSPQVTSYSTPLFVDKIFITYLYDMVLDSIVTVYNDLNAPSVEIINRNGILKQNLSLFENYMPAFMVLISLIPIASIAVALIKEKENHMLMTIESTDNSNLIHLLSYETVEIGIVFCQILIMFLCVSFSGMYYNPNLNWGGLLLVLMLISFVSCNLGLILGTKCSSYGSASLYSVLIIFLFELFGDVFFNTNLWISNLIPLKYAVRSSTYLLLEGVTLVQILPDIGYLCIFGLVSFILFFFVQKYNKSTQLAHI